MNLEHETKDGFVFLLGKEEKEAFAEILGHYPRVPEAHLQVSKAKKFPNSEETQRLLNEALADQRKENKKRVEDFLANQDRFEAVEAGWLLSLASGELEWLLQVLNDVRVGSWVSLGAPEPQIKITKVSENTIRDVWDMEIAGHFESALLGALRAQEDRTRADADAKIITLKCFGTADGWPAADRNHSSYLYRFGHTRLLIDCGDGASRSYKASGLSFDALDAIVLSHMHADHIGGFFMLMQSLWLARRRRKLHVFMPEYAIGPTREMLHTAMIHEELLHFDLEFHPLIAGKTQTIKGVKVTAYPTTHLEGLREKLHGPGSPDYSAYCFLLEHKGRRIGHSADLGRPNDLDTLFSAPLDLLVCELAHLRPEAAFAYLNRKPVKRIAFIHLTEAQRQGLSALENSARIALPNVEISFPTDGNEIVL